MKEKMYKLYKDWESTQKTQDVRRVRKDLSENQLGKVIGAMGSDGKKFSKYMNESISEFSEDRIIAKKHIASYLLEYELSPDNFELSYEQMDDRSNRMYSHMELGSPNGTITEILRAIVGGNMEIASAMTIASWGRLSIGDRNAILNLADVHGSYNKMSGVAKDSGGVKYYSPEGPIEKKGDMSKDEFIAKAFPLSDPKNTKLYGFGEE